MTLLLGRYLLAHALLGVAFALTWGLSRAKRIAPLAVLWIGRVSIAAALVLAIVAPAAPRGTIARFAPVQVWSGVRNGDANAARTPTAVALGARVPERDLATGAACLFALAALAGAIRIVRARAAVRRIVDQAPIARQTGRIEIRVSDEAAPFATTLGARSIVVIDAATNARRADRALVLRHELQHHRQLDAWLALPLAATLALFFPSPFAIAFARLLRDLEERACDDALVRDGRVPVRAYAECLLRLAERPRGALLTVSLSPAARTLKRRILDMTDRTPRLSRRMTLVAAAGSLALLLAAACASREVVDDHRVPPPAVATAAQRVSTPAFNVAADPIVVEEVNRLVATPEGKSYVRRALDRRSRYEPAILAALDAHGLPHQLAAVPLIESGFDNMGQSDHVESMAPGMAGAGVWMFIPATARAYGLDVSAERDDRLDVARETEAAMRLFGDLYAEFGDWPLALAGYNEGAKHVREAIAKHGTRDAFALMQKGALNHYAAQVMAAAIVMAEPDLAN